MCPVIDIVNDQTFEYQKGSSDSIGIFDQELVFGWDKISARDHLRRGLDYSMPFRTPTMAGGLFSIDRAYFYEIGSYDEVSFSNHSLYLTNLSILNREWKSGVQKM